MSMNNLEKLNRLRVNAGKNELKSWKASQAKLDDAIKALEDAGHTDALPGANTDAAPKIDDPEVAAARPEPEASSPAKAENDVPVLPAPPSGNGMTHQKGKPALARGLDTEMYARNCRKAVRDHREKEKKESKAKKVELSDADKKQIKDEASSRGRKTLPPRAKQPGKIVGEVDAKKEPEKAQRQKDKIAAKQEAREEKPKAEKNPNEITVADIARELDIDPKVARAKLRRHEDKLTKLHSKGQDRWTFPKTAAAEIKKILKGAK